MAIVVQEEAKRKTSLFGILIWLVIIGAVAAAIYYVFFVQPQLIEISAPGGLQDIRNISKINFQATEVVNSADFRSLNQYVKLSASANLGRNNPFLPF